MGGSVQGWMFAVLLTTISGLFYQHGLSLTLFPVWISDYMPGKVYGEITYRFLNFNGATVEV